jgi:hypothetical protein
VLVVALLGIHGFQSGQMRRLSSGRPVAARSLQYVLLGGATCIAILAVVKP